MQGSDLGWVLLKDILARGFSLLSVLSDSEFDNVLSSGVYQYIINTAGKGRTYGFLLVQTSQAGGSLSYSIKQTDLGMDGVRHRSGTHTTRPEEATTWNEWEEVGGEGYIWNKEKKSFSVNESTANGFDSFASGYASVAEADTSHVEGYQNKVYGNSGHAEGSNNNVYTESSHAEGINTRAGNEGQTGDDGKAAHAEGEGTVANGRTAHAEGRDTVASGEASHSSGKNTNATAKAAHAEGEHTTASGEQAHAEGWNTTASGGAAHAEGGDTKAIGDRSHSEGSESEAKKYASHAEGLYTKANSEAQHVQGKYNEEDTKDKFADIVGWGESDTQRKNIETTTVDGTKWLAEDVACGGTNDNPKHKLSDKVNEKSIPFNLSNYENLDDGPTGYTNMRGGNIRCMTKYIDSLSDYETMIEHSGVIKEVVYDDDFTPMGFPYGSDEVHSNLFFFSVDPAFSGGVIGLFDSSSYAFHIPITLGMTYPLNAVDPSFGDDDYLILKPILYHTATGEFKLKLVLEYKITNAGIEVLRFGSPGVQIKTLFSII